ncbi:hypothetical protein N2152v2_000902 [Parachlorella kessleri]
MQAALFGTRTLIYTHLRLVCTAWRDAFDEVVKEELKHVNLCRPLHLPFGTPSLHTSDFLRSALFLALAGVQQANLELVCQREGVAAEVDDISTVSLHAALLHFMPELQSLQLHVLDAMVAHLDRLLPRSCFLTRLELTIFNDDQERGSEDISAVQPALVSGLLHLPKLKDLCLTMFPSGSFTIQALAVAASRSLTSLSVHMDMDPEAAELFPWQHLESLSTLSALQRLSVAGCLYGPQEVPAALVGLTHLDLSDNDMGGEDGALELSVGTATGLRCLSLHSSLLQAWPEGLDQLSRLVRLNLRTTAPLLHLPHNPPLLLPRQLRFLAVGWQTLAERRESWNNFQQALPTLTHLTALQHLECSFCQPQQILAGLPHWKRLHGLILSGCNMSGAAAVHGMLEHRHISDSLRELTLRGDLPVPIEGSHTDLSAVGGPDTSGEAAAPGPSLASQPETFAAASAPQLPAAADASTLAGPSRQPRAPVRSLAFNPLGPRPAPAKRGAAPQQAKQQPQPQLEGLAGDEDEGSDQEAAALRATAEAMAAAGLGNLPDLDNVEDLSKGLQQLLAELANVDDESLAQAAADVAAAQEAQRPGQQAQQGQPAAQQRQQGDLASTLRALAEQAPSFGPEGEGDDPLQQLGGHPEMASLVDSIMQQLLSKDVLYQPMKDIGERYPAWLDANRTVLPEEELHRYSRQYEFIQQICALYESDPSDYTQLVNLLQQMQQCGQPPQEIVDELAPGMQFDSEGLPRFPGGGGGPGGSGRGAGDLPAELADCSIM